MCVWPLSLVHVPATLCFRFREWHGARRLDDGDPREHGRVAVVAGAAGGVEEAARAAPRRRRCPSPRPILFVSMI